MVREIDWDDDVGGAIRIWVYVDDFDSAEHPEYATDLVYPTSDSRSGTTRELSPEERQRWWEEAGRVQLRQLLYWRWDPIGVNEAFPFALDEYDHYVDQIGALLGRGGGVPEVAAYLHTAQVDAMGLGSDDGTSDDCRGIALVITDWQRSSVAHWVGR